MDDAKYFVRKTKGMAFKNSGEISAAKLREEYRMADADELRLTHFRPEGSDHRPLAQVKALHDARTLYVLFDISDRYVRAVAKNFGDPVCRDSCVEFFVQPKEGKGYFNFEMNCGGTLLVYYVEDPTRLGEGLKKFTKIPAETAAGVKIAHSMPKRVDPEITEPVDWNLRCTIPLDLLEHYVGPISSLSGQVWRGNFYKCGDHTSHPHWASWRQVDELNFHLPRCFGKIEFE